LFTAASRATEAADYLKVERDKKKDERPYDDVPF
jgi:hypothetical protein